jgi:CRP-like cAMP-binding protein
MEGSGPYIQLLARVPAFAAFDDAQLQTLYGFCALKVLAKGEEASIAGASVDELCIVVSGRLEAREGAVYEAGRGGVVEAAAFFGRTPARATAIALRETVLLALGWEDLASAFQVNPSFIGTVLSRLGTEQAGAGHALAVPARLVICPAGAGAPLDHRAMQALLGGLENAAEIRVLSRQSFGTGMPGALAVDSPEIAHWLQEQELEFDLTVIPADVADPDFAAGAIEEADEVIFIASGNDASLSALERHALKERGARNCRLIIPQEENSPSNHAARWTERRGYGRMQAVNFGSPIAIQLLCQAIMGKGYTIAAASAGVYAAAIWGACQALEEQGMPPVALAAAGSAVLPAGLLACGKLGTAHAVFEELANPMLWKRSSRQEMSLYDPVPLDNFLVGALQGLEIPAASRPFAAVSRSLSAGAPEVHRTGRLHGAVRGGIAPPGMLPPLILEGGNILASGETETQALLAAAQSLAASPVLYIRAAQPPLGLSQTSYRNLTGAGMFRGTQTVDKRIRAETVLAACSSGIGQAGGARSFVIPVPEGLSPMDWPQWSALRGMAYEWTLRELEAHAGFE